MPEVIPETVSWMHSCCYLHVFIGGPTQWLLNGYSYCECDEYAKELYCKLHLDGVDTWDCECAASESDSSNIIIYLLQ